MAVNGNSFYKQLQDLQDLYDHVSNGGNGIDKSTLIINTFSLATCLGKKSKTLSNFLEDLPIYRGDERSIDIYFFTYKKYLDNLLEDLDRVGLVDFQEET